MRSRCSHRRAGRRSCPLARSRLRRRCVPAARGGRNQTPGHAADLVRFARHSLERHEGRKDPAGDPVEDPLQGAEFVDGQRGGVPEQGPDKLSGGRHRHVPRGVAGSTPRAPEGQSADCPDEARGEGGDVDHRDGPRRGLHLGPVRHDHAQRVSRSPAGSVRGATRSLGVHGHTTGWGAPWTRGGMNASL